MNHDAQRIESPHTIGDTTVALGAGDIGNFTVFAVADANTFTADCSDGDYFEHTTASTAAGPTQITTTSFASAARTTNAAGVATFTWADTESTSGVDEITATPAAGTAATVDYWGHENSRWLGDI